MSLFTAEEKSFLQESLSIYLQLMQQRIPPQEFETRYALAQSVAEKIESAEAGGGTPSNKPKGITDEWFDNCCKTCDKLAPGGKCLDKITEKYPGKCDPILMYERNKNRPS